LKTKLQLKLIPTISDRLVKKTRQHIATMGETGAGITSEQQINMESNSELANKWGMKYVSNGHIPESLTLGLGVQP
jgi:hypothetical protein